MSDILVLVKLLTEETDLELKIHTKRSKTTAWLLLCSAQRARIWILAYSNSWHLEFWLVAPKSGAGNARKGRPTE